MKLISVSIRNSTDLRPMLEEFPSAFEGLEIRVDECVDVPHWADLRELLAPLQVVLTCRSGQLENDARLKHYIEFAAQCEGYLDVDLEDWKLWSNHLGLLRDRLVLSLHNYGGPEITSDQLKACLEVQSAIVKFAVTIEDSWQGLALLRRLKQIELGSSKLVFTCMGEAGQWSRMAASCLGSLWTYYCAPGSSTALGQMDLIQYEWEQFYEAPLGSDVYAIIGNPVTHSLSPRLHNAFLSGSDNSGIYVRFPTQDLNAFFELLPPEVRGLSVTTPFKQEVVQYCESLDSVASASAVVNTMLRTSSGWKGFNTDGPAIVEMAEQYWSTLNDFKTIVVLGAGAVARAVLVCIMPFRERIVIVNRSEVKARRLADYHGIQWKPAGETIDLHDSLIIQCTSVGMGDPNVSPLPKAWLNASVSLIETIYNPTETLLMRMVKEVGGRCLGGKYLFMHQAIMQQKIWFDGAHMDFIQAKDLLEIA